MEGAKTVIKRNKIDSYDIAKSDQTMSLAVDLAKFIKENKLYQNIQGKEYVNVEAWQYAGARLGILAVVEHVVNVSTDTELKYQAKVNLLSLRTEQMIGGGFAICSNKEQGKKYYQEFAIASMAQTRAIGKAYRNALAWIIKAAGYECTPVEEMEYTGNNPEPPQPVAETKSMKAVPTEEEKQKTSSEPASSPIKYATSKQKEELIRLLNNPVITRQEKTKMLLSINKLDEERANQAIAKLKKVIEDREEEQNVAA